MIDYIKILNLAVSSTDLENNKYLQDGWIIGSKNGEVLTQQTNYFGLTFSIKNTNVRLTGSIHKYENNGLHNHNDFTKTQVHEVINELSKKFEIDLQNSRLNNLEFGVNVVLPFEPKILLNSLITHKGEPFTREIEEGKIYYQCKRSQFIIKIYDKGLQYHQVANILRFELKVLKMQFFKTKGIEVSVLADLLNDGIYAKFGGVLKAYFDEILFDEESINLKDLNATERDIYLRGQNPKTWITDNRTANQQKELQRLKESFLKVLDKYRTGENFVKIVSDRIEFKCFVLSEIYQVSEEEITTVKKANVRDLHFKYNVSFGHLINQQRRGSKFLSEKTIEQNPELINELSATRRKNKRRTTKNESYFVSHNLRNDESNPRNNLRRKILKNKPSLFTIDFVVLNEDQKKVLSFWSETGFSIFQ
ncbi:hypothetical protein EMA8858_03542 [Emticicia aquatica]|uniref:Replication initiation protein n=1 Tax=Emticicia aquatica TaxID=1681835 RepID=A0ABM9AVK6_9BACT|nr:hypothetical protein [Emticicia aquatica]CAH0997409.1 hypothetical protein EMA8858_03542 [Emticicia aquatica]